MAGEQQSKLRSFSSLERRSGHRKRGLAILFGCEGDTEASYLRQVCRELGIHGDFPTATQGLDPLRLVERTMKSYDPDYDLVACVFDRDDHGSFDEARSQIRLLAGRKRQPVPIIEAVSLPCFEVWMLMHMERTDKPFQNSAQVIAHIQANHIGDYAKEKAPNLTSQIDIACENATWLQQRYDANGRTGAFTNVHDLIARLRALEPK